MDTRAERDKKNHRPIDEKHQITFTFFKPCEPFVPRVSKLSSNFTLEIITLKEKDSSFISDYK